MKRTFWLPVTVLVLASLACSLFSKPSAIPPTSLPPTAVESTAVVVNEPTETTAPEPTEAIVIQPTEAPQATETEAPTQAPAAPSEIVDTFDRNQDTWSEDLVVTSQSPSTEFRSKSIIQDGMLSFYLKDKETYMYKFYNTPIDGNVSVEADYMPIGHINNGIAIVCKANQDQTAWFEVRVSSTSDYSIYLYDKKRKTEQGKNPYLQLAKGKFKINELFPAKPNTFKVSCLDSQIVLDMNNGKRVVNQQLERKLDGNLVGVGAMSYDVVPITIEFDKITIRQEQ